MKDAIIIGGGLAGLSAAWRLRHWDTVVLESSERIGGRIRSEQRGQYFLNWGGHVFGGPGTSTDTLLIETGTGAVDVPGTLAGTHMNGKLLLKGPLQTYPFRIPMKTSDRAAMITAGMKVSKDVFRYAAVVRQRPGETGEQRQQRIYDFENDRSFADYLGNIGPEAEALFTPTVTRSAGDPDEISAGAGIGYFSLVWNIGQGLSKSILGGPSTLTETIAAALRDRISTNAQVQEVTQHKDHVTVRYIQDGIEREETARTAIMATPATVSHKIGVDLRPELREALGKVQYGSYVAGAFLTNETTPQVWDSAYGIAAPKRSMAVMLNMGNIVRGSETHRQKGGSIMCFSPATLANKLLPLADAEITDTYVKDLSEVLPGFENIIEEAHIQRWELGAPYCFPGRAKLQETLMKPEERVFLAGDYLGSLYTETAITSAFTAAQRAASLLAREHQPSYPTLATATVASAGSSAA
ncbi:flavin monoamine oxidase family protein [Corynebacterium ammoniagenes]|uniref:Oxidoreductase n=2 Tax=Corynebacterium ammoniagenes TaxID=1697 RepID=A0AAV5G7N0_CORAM|nr:FAD-dependent oxidoreductase [Corynebacterium ammoniagenes]APT82994.1 amine oxidase [Corynebacterium ammoniagenes DSM 20306]AQS74032.1 amine oxidase [Corynebacterium ammoniagenes]EFG80860.1 amine oxidase (flavin-containing) [Corynebacterium ammoniagenes DSM 20306]GJN42742.1 oxidoreductase [Corynebacterium ammoniagenes]